MTRHVFEIDIQKTLKIMGTEVLQSTKNNVLGRPRSLDTALFRQQDQGSANNSGTWWVLHGDV
jgi:hypothetical protein